jgi:hypothetical protein
MKVFGDMAQLPAGRMVKELLLVDVREVLFMSENTGEVLQPGCLVLKPYAAINRLVFANNSCTFIENSADSDNGLLYDQAIVFNVSSVAQQEFVAWLAKVRYCRFVALMRDGNDNCLIAGTLEIGLLINTTQQVADKIGIACVLTAQNAEPSAAVSTVDPSVLFADTDFGIDFSLDFNA